MSASSDQSTFTVMEAELAQALLERNLEIVPIPIVSGTTAQEASLHHFCCVCNEEFLDQYIELVQVHSAFEDKSIGWVLRDAVTGKQSGVVIVSRPETAYAREFFKKNMITFNSDQNYDKWIQVQILCVSDSMRTGEGALLLVYALWYVTSHFGWTQSFLNVASPAKNFKAMKFYDSMLYYPLDANIPQSRWNTNHMTLLEQSLHSIRLRAKTSSKQ